MSAKKSRLSSLGGLFGGGKPRKPAPGSKPLANQLAINYDAVKDGDVSAVASLVAEVKMLLQAQGEFEPWSLTLSGFEKDYHAVWEIPAARAWYGKALEAYPFLPCLLASDIAAAFLLGLTEFEAVRLGDSLGGALGAPSLTSLYQSAGSPRGKVDPKRIISLVITESREVFDKRVASALEAFKSFLQAQGLSEDQVSLLVHSTTVRLWDGLVATGAMFYG